MNPPVVEPVAGKVCSQINSVNTTENSADHRDRSHR
jgi:hypothetical protein